MMKKILAISMALCILSATPCFAGTPEFGRTEEEWAHLRDNTIEFNEIDDLIKEYNPTVKDNNFELSEFRNNYGSTNAEVSSAYAALADELLTSIDYGDNSLPNYAMTAAAAVTNQQTAKTLQTLADNTLEDYEIIRLGYEMAERALAETNKNNMIAYYSNILAAEKAGLNVDLLTEQLGVKSAQAGIGMATQTDVLTAQESLSDAQKTKITADTAIGTTKKKLQVACGYKYEDDPELGALPEPDIARVATMNPANDLQTAIDNNYTLKINKRKYDNATATTTRDQLATTMESNKQNIAISLNSAYAAVTAARDAYNYAVLANQLQQQTLANMNQKYSTGNASAVEQKTQQITTRITEIAMQQAKYALLQAISDYDYQVAGLASA